MRRRERKTVMERTETDMEEGKTRLERKEEHERVIREYVEKENM